MVYFIYIAIFIFIFWWYNTRKFNYWTTRGIKHEKPVLFLGTYGNMYIQKQNRSQIVEELYWKYPNEKVVGAFKSTTPELIIRDPDLIKDILIFHFPSFYSRGFNHSNDVEILRKHLIAIDGDLWRMLRQRMTPAFTSGKLKAMFPLIVERCEKLQASTLTAVARNNTLDARELMSRYTMEVIGACGFGIDTNTLNDGNAAFLQLGKNILNMTPTKAIFLLLKDMFPYFEKRFNSFLEIESQFLSLVNHIIKERNYKPCGRNDFIDLMLEYLNKPMEAESMEKVGDGKNPVKVKMIMDVNLFAAQVFIFFSAGFETSASSTSYTLHLLAINPDVQKKVQYDIDLVLRKYNGTLSYESIQEMTYLEWAYKEALRIFPSAGYLMRRSTNIFRFKDINLEIDERVNIIIPIQALHMDPKYWENPEEFRPERFHPDNFGATQKNVYFPFGEGPRNCIGSRLGLMQSMAGLAAILSMFTVEPAPETVRHPKIDPKSNIIQSIIGGLPLIFRERKKSVN
ncbi:unnamed protein product [Diatraea saccharalis]|uniref:unspecific monooxygenase n=1 Tax=Diatraea saccharalis TaxID=40085 RepID=A0A9N9R9I1_9NEOP|nr:unnamed protein product [Diatraea saccharalis]